MLLEGAPHIMWPLRFVMPHDPGMRPFWMIRARPLPLRPPGAARGAAGLAHASTCARHAAGAPLKPEYTRGFVYSDGWVDDARLVVLMRVDAAEHGADDR